VRLERTPYVGLDPALPQPASSESTRASAHEERVTVSAEGLLSSQESPAPPHAEVRWYRAVRFGAAGRLTGEAVSSQPQASVIELARPKNPRLAVAAYLETMRQAA